MSIPESSSANLSSNFNGSTSPQTDPAQVMDASLLGQKRSMGEEDGERLTKRRHINLDDKDQAFLKFLLPQYVPGIIIGSGGATITELMDKTNTIIKFSPSRECYPHTQERVCVVMGTIPNVCSALQEIFAKLADPSNARVADLKECLRHLKVLVSNIASGMVIGKSGHNIKRIQQECSVKIQITNKDETTLPERLLSVFGNSESIVKAAKMIMEHIREDPNMSKWKKLISYSSYSNQLGQLDASMMAASPVTGIPDYSISSGSGATMLASPQTLMPMSGHAPHGSTADGVDMSVPGATLATYEVAVPETMVGRIMGPSGKFVSDLMASTGTRIQVSAKGDYIPGTYNRKLVISGPVLAVQGAHVLIFQQLAKERGIKTIP